jgi:hypothetical protein
MARKKGLPPRQALIVAFAAGALTGAAGTLALRRRRPDEGISEGDVAAWLDESVSPSLGGRLDAPSQEPAGAPAAQHG